MKRLNRNEEAVSPVIATILMVAITVVLAATLYMMVGDIGGDDVQQLTGGFDESDNGHPEYEFASISPNPDVEDVEITVIGNDTTTDDVDDFDETYTFDDHEGAWSFLNDDDQVVGGSRFDLSDMDSDPADDGSWDDIDVDEIVIQVDDVDGTISETF
ncbi:MAG: archaellin/type IV pilin N-terminal domain-containing protein [Thermoplasmata archaeon]